ncbi:MAG: hypothetical protein ABFC57_14285 [Veillonellales bacterium]
MSVLKERIAQEINEWERLSGKKKAQIFLEKTDSSDIYIRRLILISEFAINYFPELLRFTPQKTEVENEIEFSPLINFFILLGNRRNLLDRLMKKKSV